MVLETSVIILIVNTCGLFLLGGLSLLKGIGSSKCGLFECTNAYGPALELNLDDSGRLDQVVIPMNNINTV
jgi:hypothetical protein